MRIPILILALLLVAPATAQEHATAERYARPTPADENPPQESADLWGKFKEALSTFVPPEQPAERPPDAAGTVESAESQRQALWDSATKVMAPSESDTAAPASPPVTKPHSQQECLDLANLQPGAAGRLDYYLFKVIDIAPDELYLEAEVGQKLFCLTNVDTEELDQAQQIVVLGNVRVRGTKTYKTEKGDKLAVRVVKLLDVKESELVDAERSLEKAAHPIRTWTSKDGKHKIEARFLKFAGGKVHLANDAGKNISISPNNLSDADRDYYRDLVKKAREEAQNKPAQEPANEPQHLERY